MKRWVELMVCLFFTALAMVPPASAANAPAITVGRVYDIEGDLLRYVPGEKDWVAMVKDAPFGREDTLFSGNQGMAEMIVPNGTWVRIGNSTQIQFIALDSDLSEADVASGVVRFYNKSLSTVIKATSPFGYVLASSGAVFDFYVGESSVEVVAVKGTVSFVHSATNARYAISAGSPSILADENQVSSGDGTVDPDWDHWNTGREAFWSAKARVGGQSVRYLPPGLQAEAYVLEENGRWESVPYEGSSRWFWRPTTVSVGWSPFTVGRWTEWDEDQTWIPEEPFGYVTHHYGNWVYARNYWYWAPPVASVRVGLPLLNLGFFWYPGRVSWIHSGDHVGWVPLAPRETYYSHRNWGDPRGVVVTSINVGRFNLNLRNYAYADHAIVVPRDDFYRVNNYRNVRVTNINSTIIINNYRATPVVNNTVINNYTTDKQRFNYANVTVKEKPHNTVITRIQHNETIIRGPRKESATVVRQQVRNIKEGKVNREARIEPPKTTNHIVPVNEVNRPKSEIKLQQKDIKRAEKGIAPAQPAQVVVPRYVAPARPGQKKQVVVPQHVAPAQPEYPGQVVVPQHVAPARPGRIDKVVIPEHATPIKPGQKERPGQVVVPQHVAPARPGQPATVVIPEHVLPARSNQPGSPGQVVVPQHVAPARPGQKKQVVVPQHVAPAQPEHSGQVVVPERVAPARPGRIDKVVIPEHATPIKPVQKERPDQVVVPKYVAPAQPGKPAKVVIPEHVLPARPIQTGPTGQIVVPKQVAPAQPSNPKKVVIPEQAMPVKPIPQPEHTAPAQPGKPPRVVIPEHVAPATPGQKEKPQVEPGQREKHDDSSQHENR
jgi:hypothetical protein